MRFPLRYWSMATSSYIDSYKSSLAQAAGSAREWFEDQALRVERVAFEQRSKKGTAPKCAVYAYYDCDDNALYVGQSRRRVKSRLWDETSPHAEKGWWPLWTHMRHLGLVEETDRLVLELSLILAYAPPHNNKPAGKRVSDLFAL